MTSDQIASDLFTDLGFAKGVLMGVQLGNHESDTVNDAIAKLDRVSESLRHCAPRSTAPAPCLERPDDTGYWTREDGQWRVAVNGEFVVGWTGDVPFWVRHVSALPPGNWHRAVPAEVKHA